jgi:hypothetical protein
VSAAPGLRYSELCVLCVILVLKFVSNVLLVFIVLDFEFLNEFLTNVEYFLNEHKLLVV